MEEGGSDGGRDGVRMLGEERKEGEGNGPCDVCFVCTNSPGDHACDKRITSKRTAQ